MTPLVVGMGDCVVSKDTEASLVTYALGSCIAVSIYDPVTHVGGLLHFMLPESNAKAGDSVASPFRYADTGTPLLFRTAYQFGAEKRRLQVAIAGGAAVVEHHELFNIGKRNLVALRKILWRAGVMVHAEDCGGSDSRTVRLDIDTGRFWVRTSTDRDWQLLPVKAGGSLEDACRSSC